MRNPSNDNISQLVNILSDGQFHDGTELGAQLNITRAAIWKVVKKLRSYDIAIESIKNKGYRLTSPLVLLNKKKIISALSHKKVILEILEKTDSTNEHIKKLITKTDAITVCLAETQTQGKGRLQRQWHSPFGENIYLSLHYYVQKDISELSGLSLIISLAICQALENSCQLKNTFSVKWPNDVIADNKKIAGSLIEIQAESHGLCSIIIGIGVNVNMQHTTKHPISQPWNSLYKLTHHYLDRNIICAELINSVLNYLEKFNESNLSAFLHEWKKHDYLLDKPIKISSNNKPYNGTAAGINSQGHLLIKSPDGTQRHFSSGDTTISKLAALE